MQPDALATLQQLLSQALTQVPDETRRLFHGRGRCWAGLEHVTVHASERSIPVYERAGFRSNPRALWAEGAIPER